MTAMDPLRVFMPSIGEDEHAIRERIAVCRDCASWSLREVECSHARTLLWLVVETAIAWLYCPADADTLARVAGHLHTLLQSATLAQELEALL